MILFDVRALMFWNKKKEEQIINNYTKEFKVDVLGYPVITYQHKQHLKEEAMLVNYPRGMRVLCKDNNDEPYHLGEIVNYEAISKSCNLTPVVKFDGEEEPYLVLGIIRPYSKELCSALDKLTNIEQWNVLSEFHKIAVEDL